jgi:peroxiredoxin
MTYRTLALALVLAVAIAPLGLTQDEATQVEWPAIGATAPDFELPNILAEDGSPVSLSGSLEDNDFAVVIWNSVTCPMCVPYEAILPGLVAEWSGKSIAFIGVNSNVTESNDQVAAQLQEAGFNYPVLRDEGAAVADQYGATVTPEVYIIDSDMKLLYHGRINDNQRAPQDAESHDLINALQALTEGQAPPVAETVARGCTIKRS